PAGRTHPACAESGTFSGRGSSVFSGSAGRRRRSGTATTAVVVLTCIALISGCAHTISGTPTTSTTTSANEVAGLPVTDGPSGPKQQPTEPGRPVAGTDHGRTDELARTAVADIEDYWAKTFPETFDGASFESISRLV